MGQWKSQYSTQVEALYIGDLFRKSLAYLRQRNCDEILILSAKYGAVELDREIRPYEKTLLGMKESEVQWRPS